MKNYSRSDKQLWYPSEQIVGSRETQETFCLQWSNIILTQAKTLRSAQWKGLWKSILLLETVMRLVCQSWAPASVWPSIFRGCFVIILMEMARSLIFLYCQVNFILNTALFLVEIIFVSDGPVHISSPFC